MATVAITGAARGIGLELCRQYAAQGDRVFALARDPSKARDLQALAAGSGGKVTVLACDVDSDASVRAAAAATAGVPIDLLFNVAGILGPESSRELETADWAAWHASFETMVIGPLRVLQAFLPQLGSGAKCINFSSQLAASTWPYGGYYSYAATKAGLNRMMRSVAIDLKPRGVIIGIIHPGYVQTDMGGPNAEITPAESASGIRKISAAWTLERSGDFLKWNGETHPW